jgi:hypothetical protein
MPQILDLGSYQFLRIIEFHDVLEHEFMHLTPLDFSWRSDEGEGRERFVEIERSVEQDGIGDLGDLRCRILILRSRHKQNSNLFG